MKTSLIARALNSKSFFYVKLLVGLSLISIVMAWIDASKAIQYFVGANFFLIAAGAILTVVQTILSAWKWKIILHEQQIKVPFFNLFRNYMIANFINLFSPSFVGGDAYRTASLKKYAGSISRSLSSVIVDRLTGLAALFFIGSVGLGFYTAPKYVFAISISIIAAMLILYLIIIFFVRPRIVKFSTAKSWWAIRLGRDIAEALLPNKAFAKALAVSLLFQTNTIIINVIYSASLHLDAKISELLLIVPVVYLVEMAPISINGVGVRESVFTLLFLHFGLLAEQGLALGLTITMMRYVVGAAGAIFWLIPGEKSY